MKYDLKYPRLLPLKLDHHVIVNIETGEQFLSDKHHAVVAMMHLFSGGCGEGWSKGLHPSKRGEVMGFLGQMQQMERNGMVPPDFENDLIQVGPFVTWDKCSHNKNAELIAQRFERFTERMGSDVEKVDHEIAERLRKDMDSGQSTILNDGNGGPEDLITAEDVAAKKIRTVGDVIGNNRRPGMSPFPPGMPNGLDDAIGRYLGGLGKVTELGGGAKVIEIDLMKLMKQREENKKPKEEGATQASFGSVDDMVKKLFQDDEDEKKG